MKDKLKHILTELRQALENLYGDRLSRLILFGSQARGDAEEGSDIDILLVLKSPFLFREERKRVGDLIYEIAYENDEVISWLIVDQERFETEESPLLMNVRREGLVL